MSTKAFSRAAGKPADTSAHDFLSAILRERPDLEGQMAYFPKPGTRGNIVFIGDEVFKGPSLKIYVLKFDREPELLQQLAGKGFPVPRVTCVGKESVFFGMTRVKGVPLEDVVNILTENEKHFVAKQVVDFIIGMALAVPPKDGLYMRHGDLHAGNIFVDPETKKITGIIDFGIIGYHAKKDLGHVGAIPALHYKKSGFDKIIAQEYALRQHEIPDAKPHRHGLWQRLNLPEYL